MLLLQQMLDLGVPNIHHDYADRLDKRLKSIYQLSSTLVGYVRNNKPIILLEIMYKGINLIAVKLRCKYIVARNYVF